MTDPKDITSQQNNPDNSVGQFNRVTEILSPFSGLANVPAHILKKACERGTRVHTICEAIVNGIGDWCDDPELQGYIDSFKIWWAQGHNVIDVERRFYCKNLNITGQVDYILDNGNGHTIVDLKTSYKPSKTWPLQGSAYAYLANNNGFKVNKIMFLHLNKYGNAPLEYVYENSIDIFIKCVEIHRYLND